MSDDRVGAGDVRSRGAIVGIAATALLLACALPLAVHGRRTPAAPGPASIAAAPTPAAPALRHIGIVMRARESLEAALRRGGLAPDDAGAVSAALCEDVDVVNPHPGLALALAISPKSGRDAAPRLFSLSLRSSDDAQLTLWRGQDGVLRVSRIETPVVRALNVAQGMVDGSLYLSIVGAGVTPRAAAKVVGLFGRDLDLSRDVESGDRFRLVFERAGPENADAADAPGLLYAEVAASGGLARLYRFQPGGAGAVEFLDGKTGPSRALLLRTPVDGARITSSFGPRLHPILGFTRMHQGIDFGAGAGAPVFAAGDGVVEEANWSGGYGRWLKIRHAQGVETGYAHLSAWAPGIAPGASVRQGQVVAFVGATGLATGPHLHYEVFTHGRRIDPSLARTAMIQGPDPGGEVAFRAQKARIDAIVGLPPLGIATGFTRSAQAHPPLALPPGEGGVHGAAMGG